MAKKAIVKKAPAKKVALKKTISKKPNVPLLLEVFKEIKGIMKEYESKLNVRINIEGKYDLWSEKDVEAFGRSYDSMYFAGITIQGGYVGFYFMPIYCDPELKKEFSADFLKLLKGKSCFHIKKLDEATLKEIKKALKIGYAFYKKRNWV